MFNDEKVLDQYLRPSIRKLDQEVALFALDNTANVLTTNIASLYNLLGRLSSVNLRAFLHPDIAFEASFLDDLFKAIHFLEQRDLQWGALGIVGRSWQGDYLWCHEVSEPTLVCCLDACSLITDVGKGIRFDQKWFNEFHCYVEDYCLQCHAAGLGVYVFPTIASHGSATKSVRGGQWGKYRKYRRRLQLKWRRKFRTIYTC